MLGNFKMKQGLYAYVKFRNGKEVQHRISDKKKFWIGVFATILSFIIGIPAMFGGIWVIERFIYTFSRFL